MQIGKGTWSFKSGSSEIAGSNPVRYTKQEIQMLATLEMLLFADAVLLIIFFVGLLTNEFTKIWKPLTGIAVTAVIGAVLFGIINAGSVQAWLNGAQCPGVT